MAGPVSSARRGGGWFGLIERLTGRRIEVPAGLPLRTVIRHYAGKATLPLLRGVLRRPFLGAADGALFVGRGVVLRFPDLLSCGRSVSLGDGVRIDALSRHGVRLGHRVSIREGGILQLTSHLDNLGDTIEIGDDVYIGPHAFIGAGAAIRIGSRTLVGPRLTIIAEEHDFQGERPVFEQGVTRGGVTIGEDCWLGACVTVLDGVTIGRNCVVGAGALVTRSLPDNAVAYGVPARVVRLRAPDASRSAFGDA